MCNIYKIKDDLHQLKWKGQRFKKGYADTDVWNIYHWFLDIMPNMLQELRDNLHGHPYELTQEEWEGILDDMIHCFREANEDTCSMKNEYEGINQINLIDNEDGTSSLKPNNLEIHEKWIKREHEIESYRNKNLYHGLDLFKEYFNNLWD